ncbi:MAG: GIY-YIG nuclease family protein [Ignavibacteriales bacterium]|nr:GIY-YIG nuclease family protein [Ignavibacteriales bacterium]
MKSPSETSYTVYVLRSLSDMKRYIGMTNNINRCIREHNSAKVFSIKSRHPFSIIYHCQY